MSEVLDFYLQEASQRLTTALPGLSALQQAGATDLQQQGFPLRQDEAWKYTQVSAFLKQRFITGNAQISLEAPEEPYPAGVLIQPLALMLRDHAALIKPYLGQLLAHEHGFLALNSVMLRDGMVIYLPSGVQIEKPIVLRHEQTKENQAVYLRHLVIAEDGSQATVVQDYAGTAASVYCTNSVTEIFVATGAKISHYTTQRESEKAIHLHHMAVKQQAKSQFFSHLLNFGGQLVRSDLQVDLVGEKATCWMNGVYLPGGQQHMDSHTRVNHWVPDCTSEQDYKGILQAHSRAVFNGQVMVAKGAHGTCAKQQNKNILLAADAEIDTKPQLEILADDVLCSHGATVGQLDEDARFYLSSRGMDKTLVEQYLIQAFIAANLGLLDHAMQVCWLRLINEKIGMTVYE